MKHNILHKIIKSVLTEQQTVNVPVKLNTYSVDNLTQQKAEKAGAVFSFRVTTKGTEKGTAAAPPTSGVGDYEGNIIKSTDVPSSPSEPIMLKAIQQFLSKTTSTDVSKYLNGGYWLVMTPDLSSRKKFFQYIFYVFPYDFIKTLTDTIMINDPGKFTPKVEFYINSTPVSRPDDFYLWRLIKIPSSIDKDVWIWENGSRNIEDWYKVIDKLELIHLLGYTGITAVPGWKSQTIEKIKAIFDNFSGEIRGRYDIEPPSFLDTKTKELNDFEIQIGAPFDRAEEDKDYYMFDGKSVFIKTGKSGALRKYIGKFNLDGSVKFNGSVEYIENGMLVNGDAINLEILKDTYYTGYIKNNMISSGELIFSLKNEKYIGIFELVGNAPNFTIEYETGLLYRNDVLVEIWEKGRKWTYDRYGRVAKDDSMYQIKELQEDIIKMWNNNIEYVNAKIPKDAKNMINKFVQNGPTGIWNKDMEVMVYTLNVIFAGAKVDGSTPNAGLEIQDEERKEIIKFQTSNIGS
jgi:hypothetical protein